MTTVIICPACAGTKTDKATDLACTWCKGTRVVSEDKAKEYDEVQRRLRQRAAFEGYGLKRTS